MAKSVIVIGDDYHNVLRQIAEEVDVKDIEVLAPFIDELLDTSLQIGAAGLAAPQLGESKRIFVITLPGKEPLVCINPKIIGGSGNTTSYDEGCLSVPGKRYNIKRARRVILRYLDRQGNPQLFKPRKKITNIAIQHELDHLNGVLVCDKGKET